MKTHNFRIVYRLSVLILVFSAIASAGGLFWDGLYRDSDFIRRAWFGNDLITLFVILPMLVVSIRLARRGSLRALLVWLGLLGYLFYNYAFYLFGAEFNAFFLLYVALYTASMYALILGLGGLDVRAVSRRIAAATPVRWIMAYLIFIALVLGAFEIGQSLMAGISGEPPMAPPLIFALDLAFVVTTCVVGAVLLARRHPWGYILAMLMLVKGFTYGLVLMLGTALNAAEGGWDPLMPFYTLVMLGGLAGGVALLRAVRPEAEAVMAEARYMEV